MRPIQAFINLNAYIILLAVCNGLKFGIKHYVTAIALRYFKNTFKIIWKNSVFKSKFCKTQSFAEEYQ